MILLGEVERKFWSFVGFISSTKLNILTKLVVHSLVEGIGKFGGGLISYICYMVSTTNLFNLSLVSQYVVNLFSLGSWSLNTYYSLMLLWVVTLTSTMLIKTTTILTSIVGLNFVCWPPLSTTTHASWVLQSINKTTIVFFLLQL